MMQFPEADGVQTERRADQRERLRQQEEQARAREERAPCDEARVLKQMAVACYLKKMALPP